MCSYHRLQGGLLSMEASLYRWRGTALRPHYRISQAPICKYPQLTPTIYALIRSPNSRTMKGKLFALVSSFSSSQSILPRALPSRTICNPPGLFSHMALAAPSSPP